MNKIETDILIIGGGPSGLAAASAASDSRNVKIAVVDDNPQFGGQIWRGELGKIKSGEAQNLLKNLEKDSIQMFSGTQIFACGQSENSLSAETANGLLEFRYQKLILATGARERFLPFPKWTLPGVFGAGGLQALVKGGFPVKDKKIVVAGTGALLLAVASYLKSKGGKIILIAEQSSPKNVYRLGLSLARFPGKLTEAVKFRADLFGVPYYTDCFPVSAEGTENLEAVNLRRRGRGRRVECDYLACGFHLVPNNQIAALLNCEINDGFVSVDEFQTTTVSDVFCAGESTGIGGLELSLIEGKIAGLAAVGDTNGARKFFAAREKAGRFAANLERAFALRDELKNLPDENTIVCRCEDVAFGKLKNFDSWRAAKLQTRCGMGACQGRICGGAVEFLFDWKTASVRPPLFPARLESLAGADDED